MGGYLMYIHEPIHVSSYGTTVNIYAAVKERKDMSPFLTVLKKVYKMSDADRYAAFGDSNVDKIIDKLESGAEFIDKYYEWEDNNAFTVGDEVRIKFFSSGDGYLYAWVTYIDNGTLECITSDGKSKFFSKKDCKKTGRHSETLAKLFDELKGME